MTTFMQNITRGFYPLLVMLFKVFIAAMVIFGLFYLIRHLINKEKSNRRENKKVKGEKLKYGSKNEAHGFIFGWNRNKLVYSPTENESHCIVMGGSGTGKTSAILIPTLRHWKGTFLTIDISGDIKKNVRKKNSIIFDPQKPDCIPYDVFGAIDLLPSKSDRNEALTQLAWLIIPDDPNAQDATKYFNDYGRKILIASLIAFYHQGMDFIDICKKVAGSNYIDLFTEIDNSGNQEAIMYINGFEGANEKNTAGCKQTVDDKLLLFATNLNVQNALRKPRVNENSFTPFSLNDHNVFVVIPDEKLKLYGPLLNIITAQSLEFLSMRPNDEPNKILLCLDEFASLGKLDILDALRKLRKKNVRIMVLTQSFPDIDLIYGKDERMAMMGNFAHKVILEASETETQEWASKLTGQEEMEKTSKTYDGGPGPTSKTKSKQKENLVEPWEFANLGDNLILLFPGGYKRLKKNFFFKYDENYVGEDDIENLFDMQPVKLAPQDQPGLYTEKPSRKMDEMRERLSDL